MKVVKNSLIIISILLPCISSNCRKDPKKELICEESNTIKFPKKWLSYFYFKDSTYWIYADSLNGTIDSVFITKKSENITNDLQGRKLNTKCYQSLTNEFHQTLETYRTQVRLMPFRVSDDPGIQERYDCMFMIIDTNNNSFPIYRFGFVDSTLTKTTDEGGVIEESDSILVSGKYYQGIICLNYPSASGDIYKKAYYARNIGLVKYALKDGTVWELRTYKIIQ